MTLLYTALAVAGGTLLACQLLATLAGLGGDDLDADAGDAGGPDLGGPDLDGLEADAPDAGDADGDHDHHAYGSLLGKLSVRSVTAAATFAGLGGLIAQELRLSAPAVLLASAASGLIALLLVARVMRALHRLGADGTVDTTRVEGRYGTVYVRVPADGGGAGKVLLEFANRTVELAATTVGPELPSGTPVVVRAVTGPDAVDVAAVNPDDPRLGPSPLS